MEELNYKRLRDLQRQEKEGAALVELPEDFIRGLEAFLDARRAEAESSHSIVEMREFENVIRIVREIFSIRRQKITFRAVRSGMAHETGGMSAEEHRLYDSLCSVLSESTVELEGMLGKASKIKIPAGVAADANLKKVRLTKAIPAYRGADSVTYGPFLEGQEISLPLSEADWLLASKMARTA
jgi:DNA replication initiation complex subunit (GINS family)